jgi:hypothetical protein
MVPCFEHQGWQLWGFSYDSGAFWVRRRWRWRWCGAEIQAERGFWALEEAIVDAVVMRYPAVFDGSRGEESW